jgi:hypothetical protein
MSIKCNIASIKFIHWFSNSAFATDLKIVLEFLKSLWAILAQISVLFPYSSQFFELIPLESVDSNPGYPFYFMPLPLISLVATLSSVFTILLTFNQLEEYKTMKWRLILQRKAIRSFLLGILGVLTYLGLRHMDVGDIMCRMDLCNFWSLKQLVKFIVDIVMLCCYSIFFCMITRAFMVLGMVTYFARYKDNRDSVSDELEK